MARFSKEPEEPPATELAVGQGVGRDFAGYRIEAQIGQGGIGVVYRAHDPRLGRSVALKLLRVDAVGPSQGPRFEREGKALAALSHPNIVSILDCGVSDSVPYLVMELLDGQSLSQALEHKPFDRKRAARVTRELLSALAYVHEQGLVHRDLKPGNVFLQKLPSGGEQVKLLDFGLAKFIDRDGPGDTTLTRTGEVFGTPAYMPPEQWSGDKVDASADVYSAAAVCFEMLAGRRPFISEGQDLLRAQLLETPPFLHEACPDRVARPELERALQKALSKRARDRQPNAAELEEQLKAVPEPWCYEGKEVTEERKRAAEAARDDLHMAMAPQVERAGAVDSGAKTVLRVKEPVASRPVRKISLLRELLRRLLLLGAWTLSFLSLVVIGVAATLIYLSRDSANPEARKALEAALPQVRDVVERGKNAAKDAVASAKERVSDALPSQPDAGAPTQTKAPPRSAPRVRAVNPWKQPIPRELRQHRWKLEVGQEGDRDMIKELKRYARIHHKDPRGNLLLARLYANRDAWNDAVAHYKIAFERDPSSRGDPRMLKDLVLAVAEKESSWRASELIPIIYGPEALAEIKRVTSRTHDNEERLRLEQLAHTLAP
jgi:serine/threonine-protein kinase